MYYPSQETTSTTHNKNPFGNDDKNVPPVEDIDFSNNDDSTGHYDEESKSFPFYDDDDYLSDDDDDDDDNGGYNTYSTDTNHSLISVEEARIYAGRILSARSSRDLFFGSRGNGQLTLSEEEVDDNIALALQKKSCGRCLLRRNRRRGVTPVCVLLALILLIVALMGLMSDVVFTAISTEEAPLEGDKEQTATTTSSSYELSSSTLLTSSPLSLSPTIISTSNDPTTTITATAETSLDEEEIQEEEEVSSSSVEEEEEESSVNESLLTKLCTNDNNFQDMYQYLDATTTADDDNNNNTIYMIEMVKFHDDGKKGLYEQYMAYLTDVILPNIDGARIVFRMKNPITIPSSSSDDENHYHHTTSNTNNHLQDWDEMVVIQYPKASTYLQYVLMEESRMYNVGDTDYGIMKELLEARTMAIQQSHVWVASLNQDINTDYPGLVMYDNNDNNNVDDNNNENVVANNFDDTLILHAYKYNNHNNQEEGSDNNNIANYDQITESIKHNNDMYTLAWLDIHASCSTNVNADDDTSDSNNKNNINSLDQIRIETMGNYLTAIGQKDWYQGLQYLHQGIDTDHSLTTLATQSISTNLYEKSKQI